MLDLTQHSSLGSALHEALVTWPNEVCLIEADRERENCRLTYRQFGEAALPLARGLQDEGFAPGDRAAIIMTNQSKWLISAYAIFYAGGVLVPLDYKLTAREHLALLAHSKAKALIVEYHLWRAITAAPEFRSLRRPSCWSPKLRRTPSLPAPAAGKSSRQAASPPSSNAHAATGPPSSIPRALGAVPRAA